MNKGGAQTAIHYKRGDAFIPYTERAAPLESLIAGFHAAAVKAESGLWDVFELAMQTSDTLFHLRALDWLKPDTPHIWSLGKNPECRKAAKDGSLKPAPVPRMGTWGIARGGWCLTQTQKPEPGIGEGCSLSEILVPDAPERYYLPEKQVAKLLYRAAPPLPEDDAGGEQPNQDAGDGHHRLRRPGLRTKEMVQN